MELNGLWLKSHFCSDVNAGEAISLCSSGTLILWIITGDVGGGGIVSVAVLDFLDMFAWKRGSCGRVAGFIGGGCLAGSLWRVAAIDPPPPPPMPLMLSSSAWTSGSRAKDDL